MKKKIVSAVLASAMVMSLASCAKPDVENTETSESETTTEETTETEDEHPLM